MLWLNDRPKGSSVIWSRHHYLRPRDITSSRLAANSYYWRSRPRQQPKDLRVLLMWRREAQRSAACSYIRGWGGWKNLKLRAWLCDHLVRGLMDGHGQCMVVLRSLKSSTSYHEVSTGDIIFLGLFAICHWCSQTADDVCCIVFMIYELASC